MIISSINKAALVCLVTGIILVVCANTDAGKLGLDLFTLLIEDCESKLINPNKKKHSPRLSERREGESNQATC